MLVVAVMMCEGYQVTLPTLPHEVNTSDVGLMLGFSPNWEQVVINCKGSFIGN